MSLPFALPSALPHVRPAASVTVCTTPQFPLIIGLETLIVVFTASGRFGYWRGNVHNMNYSRMRSSHSRRQVCLCTGESARQLPLHLQYIPHYLLQKQETAKTKKKTRQRSGNSFSILTLTENQWTPKMSILKVGSSAQKKINCQ